MSSAPVNKIIPISTVDGPGARTSIFLQGCNIACGYCHNPETQNLCIHCAACVYGCPAGALSVQNLRVVWDEAKCTGCDTCLQACDNFASPKVREMRAEEVMVAVRKNLPFVRGITVSGGECTLYPQFLEELFTLAKAEGLGCLLDSNGSIALGAFPKLLELCDGVMLDVKAWEPAVYAALTGGYDNAPVKKNLALLASLGKLSEIRIVCLPGHVDAEGVLDGVAEILPGHYKSIPLKLIRFRPNGVRGDLAEAQSPDDAQMNAIKLHAAQKGFEKIIVV